MKQWSRNSKHQYLKSIDIVNPAAEVTLRLCVAPEGYKHQFSIWRSRSQCKRSSTYTSWKLRAPWTRVTLGPMRGGFSILTTTRDPCSDQEEAGCTHDFVKARNKFPWRCSTTLFYLHFAGPLDPAFQRVWEHTQTVMSSNGIGVIEGTRTERLKN